MLVGSALVSCQARPSESPREGPSPGNVPSDLDTRAARLVWQVPTSPGLAVDGGGQRVGEDGLVTVLVDTPTRAERVGDAWVRDIAQAVSDRVRTEVRPGAVQSASSPAETLARGVGDCTEMADLAAELLREQGVDARVVAGVAYHEGALRWHAWNEYWDGRWATLDVALNQHPVDATHLRLDLGASTRDLVALDAFIAGRADGSVAPVTLAPRAR